PATEARDLPAARRCDVTEQAELPDRPYTRIYVCQEEDDEGLRMGLRAARSRRGDVVICLSRQSAFREALTAGERLLDDMYGRLRIFGILDESCHPELVQSDHIDQLARAIHARYVESLTAGGQTRATNASLVPWEQLPPELKRSNYAQAEDVGRKLRKIGCTIVPAMDETDTFSYRDGEVLELATMEHERWMAEKAKAGIVFGPDRSPGQHPDLRPWDELAPSSRAKDIDAVEHIPHLLAQAGFQVLRVARAPAQ
ncbi:MAG: hypothetical protein ACRDTT_17020, partial [Pseudonocardiaceae bacterium]